jgi:transposase
MELGFDENDLYKNLSWVEKHQEEIETRLYRVRQGKRRPELFLYDVTSSYLEGDKNKLAEYGYNRDRKKGKKQIVLGLLCDEVGEPVSIEVFRGNTQDISTFASQVEKVGRRFGCERVTFVGDRGMIKSAQVEALKREGFHYISALTKPQIEVLMREGVLQLEMFDEEICEVETEGVRYVLRRNPQRAEEIASSRRGKQASIEKLVEKKNNYLRAHPRATVEVALREVVGKIEQLKIDAWLRVRIEERGLALVIEEMALSEEARLDGCYVIKTDLPKAVADKEVVHDRYKDLALIERAFRTCKTGHLEVRPVYVRTDEHTRAHAFVVMLAYMIERELRRKWVKLDITVEEGIKCLKELCSMKMIVNGKTTCQVIPEPREDIRLLLAAAEVKIPEALPWREHIVATKVKLPTRRKSA